MPDFSGDWSQRRVARETRHQRLTVWRVARELAHTRGEKSPQAEAQPSPPATDPPQSKTTSRSSCEPHRLFIEAERQEPKRRSTFRVSRRASGLRRPLQRRQTLHAETTCSRTLGELPVRSQCRRGAARRLRRRRLFVMTRGYSRHAFRKVVMRSSTKEWCRLQEKALAYLEVRPKRFASTISRQA